MVAIFWFCVSEHLHSMFYRVERQAHIADGPTSPDDVGCSLLRKLCAAELPAYLVGWLAYGTPFANDAMTCEDILIGWADRAQRDEQGPAVVFQGLIGSPW